MHNRIVFFRTNVYNFSVFLFFCLYLAFDIFGVVLVLFLNCVFALYLCCVVCCVLYFWHFHIQLSYDRVFWIYETNIYIYVCMYVYMYVCNVCVCMYVYVCVCMYICMYVMYVYVCMYMCVCIMCVCIYVCMFMYVCMYVCMWVLCVVRSASDWSLVQRSPTECGVSECDRDALIMRRPWPTGAVAPWRKKIILCHCSSYLTVRHTVMWC